MPINSASIIFCEDVREEDGNKASYMGVLGPKLVFESFPVLLPRLCIVMSADIENERKVSFHVSVSSPQGIMLPPPIDSISEQNLDLKFWNLNLNIAISNLQIKEPSSIVACFKIEDFLVQRTVFLEHGTLIAKEKGVIGQGILHPSETPEAFS